MLVEIVCSSSSKQNPVEASMGDGTGKHHSEAYDSELYDPAAVLSFSIAKLELRLLLNRVEPFRQSPFCSWNKDSQAQRIHANTSSIADHDYRSASAKRSDVGTRESPIANGDTKKRAAYTSRRVTLHHTKSQCGITWERGSFKGILSTERAHPAQQTYHNQPRWFRGMARTSTTTRRCLPGRRNSD